jgi:hypothetical protein
MEYEFCDNPTVVIRALVYEPGLSLCDYRHTTLE